MADAFETAVTELMTWGFSREVAEARVRSGLPHLAPAVVDPLNEEIEDAIAEACDKLLRGLGFFVVRLAQKRASKITAGVPDRYAIHCQRRLAVWLEYKSPAGRVRPAQSAFRDMCLEAGIEHVLGGITEVRAWLTEKRVATFDERGMPEPVGG